MNFRVGQKVVCVDDNDTQASGAKQIVAGSIYTIRWQGMAWDPSYGTEYCVRLVGIVRPDTDHWARLYPKECSDVPFRASRFRPLVEKKTDAGMAILKTILDEVNAGKHREIVDA